jgi:molybdate transport system ATP-binding protein
MQFLGYHDHLLKVAAVVYRSGKDDIDRVLAEFAADLVCQGVRVGGVVQYNGKYDVPQGGMALIDLLTGRKISISQPLGADSNACRLDPSGLAEATVAVKHAIAQGVELVIVNKFSKQEAAGGGLRSSIADAVVEGLPTLTAVSDKCYDDWMAFTGGFGTTLACERRVVADWWQEISRRERRTRVLASLERVFDASTDTPPVKAIEPALISLS